MSHSFSFLNVLRHVAVLVAAGSAIVPSARGQQPTRPSLGQPVRLSLGDAARLAARQSNAVQGAEQRVAEAEARVRQSRAALLPELSANALQSGRTFNSVTFGITLPTAPGQPPLFNPEGQVLGPVNTLDLRGHAEASLLDPSAIARVRTAQIGVNAARADVVNTGDLAATQAAAAYVRVLRGNAQLNARLADSVLGRELLN